MNAQISEADVQQGKKSEKEKETNTNEEKNISAEPDAPLAIVGIGASAGGLEALEQFFSHMPADSGMAFIVIQHQDPEQPSLLPEILQRYTEMPVTEIAKTGTDARQNTVYIKPPDFDLSIIRGRLTLLEPRKTAGLKMPIDIFFRQLAEDQDGKAVGIVLSGMGSDGTLGIRALKERPGMVMAQEPSSAMYASMPESAIATGLVDFIAPPENLPQLLIDYIDASSLQPKLHAPATEPPEDALAKIFILIRSKTGQDFSLYKRNTIIRRIERRMSLHQLKGIDGYVRYLQENPPEIEILAKEVLIGVTQFFRDPEAWDALMNKALPELINQKPDGSILRVWIVGCSTGEEAYTMAIVLQECLDSLGRDRDIRFQIFATDMDGEAIERARMGRFPVNIASDVSPERLERFFIKEDETYRVRQQLRETIVFAQQNVIRDPPFTHVDILSCRNLLIYLSPELQKKVIILFHYALNPNGILFLGTAESIGEYKDLFRNLDSKWKIFSRLDVLSSPQDTHEMLAMPATSKLAHELKPPLTVKAKGLSINVIAKERILEIFAPPVIIVTENGDIVYFHGKTGKYLEPSTGKANMNLFAMAHEGLIYPLTSALRTASSEKHRVDVENVSVRSDDRDHRIRLIVEPMPKRSGLSDLYLVAFEDIPEPTQQVSPVEHAGTYSSADERIAELERELADTRLQLQHTVEDSQSSQEEMLSMNEEFQSTNEELQSTNEELTTSKEELQSLNEELLTVNSEHQAKIEELIHSQDDMRNLLKGTEIPMLFLDNNLRVRRFTESVKPIINFIGNDVGRPINDLKVNLEDESFIGDLQEVLDSLQFKEKQVKTVAGEWFQMRILPYRTAENRIDGLVVTFSDITETKQLEQSLRYSQAFTENIIDTLREPLIVLDSDLKVVLANRSFYKTFNVSPEETVGKLFYTLGNNQWDLPQLRTLLEEILPENTEFEDFEVKHNFPQIGKRIMKLNARKIQSDIGQQLILLSIEDVTDKLAGGGGGM
jgi:two-component system CheB/CheR fusion protein